MGKRLRCRLGNHEWELTGKGDDMICKFCGKEFDDDRPVGDIDEATRSRWEAKDDYGGA